MRKSRPKPQKQERPTHTHTHTDTHTHTFSEPNSPKIYPDLKYSNKPSFVLSIVSAYSFGNLGPRLLQKWIEN